VNFIGRATELAILSKRLERAASSRSGVAVTIRGRRQVGKSRLVQEFCDQSGVRYCFFTATKGASPAEEVGAFCRELRESSLPSDPELVPLLTTGSWSDAFRVVAAVLPDSPAIVVLDELPWLAEQDPAFDGALQTAWDRLLSRRPMLLLLLGSDLHMMDRLTGYDQPFFGRADNLALAPLSVADTADALELGSADAIDAQLVCGGLPGILRSWPPGMSAREFLRQECADPAAPVFTVPEAALLAEFPAPDQTRRVLEAVGGGDRTQANIAAAAGGTRGDVPSGALTPILRRLVADKRVLAIDEPLSVRPGRPALYRVAESNLRLYLAALRPAHEQARRGRPDAAFRLVERRWTTWRGRAVEPLVRQSLELAAGSGTLPWPEAEAVGGWWNRRFDPEVDLVGADRYPVAGRVMFAGSVKWVGTAFDRHDLNRLNVTAATIPGYTPGSSGLVIVSLSGLAGDFDRRTVDAIWGPDDIVAAWRGPTRSER
jgi:hypothetical protein